MDAKSSTHHRLLLLLSKTGSQGQCPRVAAPSSHAWLCGSGRKESSPQRSSSQIFLAPSRDDAHSLYQKRSGSKYSALIFFFPSMGVLGIESRNGIWVAKKGISDRSITLKCWIDVAYPLGLLFTCVLEQMIWVGTAICPISTTWLLIL